MNDKNNTTDSGLSGLFTVAPNKQVHFAQGNLQYQASTGTWRFAERQYDCVGQANSHISRDNEDWIDLFGWGTAGWMNGAKVFQPWGSSTLFDDYHTGGSPMSDLVGTFAEADWAWHNAIVGGGDKPHLWRTPTAEEWRYLLTERPAAREKFGTATVAGVHGLVVLPDSWTQPKGLDFTPGLNGWGANYYPTKAWQQMEQAGALFLPATGNRVGTNVGSVGEEGRYWSTTHKDRNSAVVVNFGPAALMTADFGYRNGGFAVRAIKE